MSNSNQLQLFVEPLSASTYLLTVKGSSGLKKSVRLKKGVHVGTSLAIIASLGGSNRFTFREPSPGKLQFVETEVGEYGLAITDDMTLDCLTEPPAGAYIELEIRKHDRSRWWVKKYFVPLRDASQDGTERRGVV